MSMFGAKDEDHGSDLANEFHEFLANHAERIKARKASVQARLAALEAEHADLHRVERKVDAAQKQA